MSLPEVPPHVRLMLLAARPPCGEAAPLAAAVAAEPVDWGEFFLVTTTHRLTPLVYRALREVPGVPADVLARLRGKVEGNRVHGLRLMLEQGRLAGAFAASGLELTALKGSALSAQVYGDPLLRHCGDLDLLVSATDAAEALALLGGLGYRLVDPGARLTPGRLRVYQQYWKGVTLEHERTGIAIDLHWRLFHNRRHPANRLSSALPRVGLARSAGWTLPVEAHFVYSAAHGAWDQWVYFKGLADVAAMLDGMSAGELDRGMRLAAELGLLRQVSSAVHLAREWLGADAEHPLLLPASDAFHGAMRRKILRELQACGYRPERRRAATAAAVRSELRLVPGVGSAREILGRYLWRPRVWGVVPLPDRLIWLSPVVGALLPPRVVGGRRSQRDGGRS